MNIVDRFISYTKVNTTTNRENGAAGIIDRFARSQSRDAGQDNVYYHHAAGHDIVRKAWDEPLTGEAGEAVRENLVKHLIGPPDGKSTRLLW